MTVGANGEYALDTFSASAQEIFGLGRRRRGARRIVRKVVKKVIRYHPLSPVAHARFITKVVKKVAPGVLKKKRRAVAPPEAMEPPEEEYVTPVEVEERGSPEVVPVEEREVTAYAPVPTAVPPPPPPLEARYGYPPIPVPEYGPPPPEAVEYRREGAYSIGPGEEPWAVPAAEAQQVVEYAEGEEAPAQSIEGNCCGGFIVTGPTPKQRDYTHPRSWAATLRPQPYRGLGQAEPFWYAPQWVYQRRPVRTSSSPSAGFAVHRGSPIWGRALAGAHRAAQVGRHGGAAWLPFELGQQQGAGPAAGVLVRVQQEALEPWLREFERQVARLNQVLVQVGQGFNIWDAFREYIPKVFRDTPQVSEQMRGVELAAGRLNQLAGAWARGAGQYRSASQERRLDQAMQFALRVWENAKAVRAAVRPAIVGVLADFASAFTDRLEYLGRQSEEITNNLLEAGRIGAEALKAAAAAARQFAKEAPGWIWWAGAAALALAVLQVVVKR